MEPDVHHLCYNYLYKCRNVKQEFMVPNSYICIKFGVEAPKSRHKKCLQLNKDNKAKISRGLMATMYQKIISICDCFLFVKKTGCSPVSQSHHFLMTFIS